MTFPTVLAILLFSISAIVSSQPCNGTIPSAYLLSAPTSQNAGNTCPWTLNNTCCAPNYFSDLAFNYTNVYYLAQQAFNLVSQTYYNKIMTLFNYSSTFNITYVASQAFNWTYIDPTSDFINPYYLLAVPNILTEYTSTFYTMISSFQSCAAPVLQHYAGLQCSNCNPSFYTQGFMFDANGNLQENIDYSTCSQIQRPCYNYITARAYMTNLINLADVMVAIMQNNATLGNYTANSTNMNYKLAFANALRNVSLDMFEFPDGCNSQYDCSWICWYVVNNQNINISTLVNPTSRYQYNISSFRRVLEQIHDHKLKHGKFSPEEPEPTTRNLQPTPANLLPPQVVITNPSGLLYTTNGWKTMVYGTWANSGFNTQMLVTNYTFPSLNANKLGMTVFAAAVSLLMILIQ